MVAEKCSLRQMYACEVQRLEAGPQSSDASQKPQVAKASGPQRSADLRIGPNMQHLAPYVRQTKHDADTAVLVRGQDRHHHFGSDIVAQVDLDPVSIARQQRLDATYREIAGRA